MNPNAARGKAKSQKKSRGGSVEKSNKQHRRDWVTFIYSYPPLQEFEVCQILDHAMHKTGKSGVVYMNSWLIPSILPVTFSISLASGFDSLAGFFFFAVVNLYRH